MHQLNPRIPPLSSALALTALTLCLLGLPLPAHAWRTAADLSDYPAGQPVGWQDPSVSYTIVRREPSGWTEVAFVNAIGRAAHVWSGQPCGPTLARTTGPDAAASGDGFVTIEVLRGRAWSNRGFDADAAATTDLRYAEGPAGQWQIVDADIYINGGFDWNSEAADLEASLVHEFGHVLGLLHCCETGGAGGAPSCASTPICDAATMHPQHLGPEQRSLSADDVQGLCFLYERHACADDETCLSCIDDESCPAGHTCDGTECRLLPEPTPAECDSDESCPTGRACVEGRCSTLEIGDPCSAGVECAHGLCVDDHCTAACGDAVACPDGHSCSEGICAPELELFGGACEAPSDCAAGVCLAGDRSAPVCSRACAAPLDCPANWQCTPVSGRDVCTPVPLAGCSATAPGQSHHNPLGAVLALALALVLSRKRR